jgi:DNA-binding transcriptional ArsR family regulator
MNRHEEMPSPGPASLPGGGVALLGALANPWRSRILGELCRRPMSPSQFTADVGGEISTISRHFRWLADLEYISVAAEMTGGARRGAVERVYAPAQLGRIGLREWGGLSLERRKVWTRGAVALYFRRIFEAIEAGTFDSEDERHFSWDAVAVDRQAWRELTARLDEVLDWLPQLEAESARRETDAIEPPLLATVGLGAFSSPPQTALRASKSSRTGDRA